MEQCRMFTDGQCTLHEFDDEQKQSLEVSVPGSTPSIFRVLNVVTVQLSCNADEAKARISKPVAHLLQREFSDDSYHQHSDIDRDFSIKGKSAKSKRSVEVEEYPEHGHSSGRKSPTSIYSIISSIEITPKLARKSEKCSKLSTSDRFETLPGRFIFNNFRNPNKANNEIEGSRLDIAVVKRSAMAIPDGYDAQKRIEKEVTSRIQRLAAEKRHSRMAKAGRKK
eukprot:CAMPEP_0196828636 /NCGR_PEP_ID=MMETSP1362-20130617/94781_1 /TAXON_ID=163516 /ORGANISM="Leptocylindrus danicus, Strain CCMP1856" /LENGTH=223 /DNA_ID=CAMNT_0042209319 /DNA_START=518 /DNA_END=1189 /DNA_ORIENTATION=+